MSTAQPVPILLVEDDEGQAMLVQDALKEAGVINEIYHV
jgi:hypothetical protein